MYIDLQLVILILFENFETNRQKVEQIMRIKFF